MRTARAIALAALGAGIAGAGPVVSGGAMVHSLDDVPEDSGPGMPEEEFSTRR